MKCGECGGDHEPLHVSEEELKFAVTVLCEALDKNNIPELTALMAMDILKQKVEQDTGIHIHSIPEIDTGKQIH